ncbi:MAG: NAD(P)-dependent oxidoreductase [Acidimicrobiia bacterium]
MTVRVIDGVGLAAERIRAEFPEVDVRDLAEELPPPDGATEVLFGGWDDEKLRPVLARGIDWVQLPGTGIDGIPPDLFHGVRVVTCARGASAVPISEYVLAVMLAFVKGLPGFWLDAPPERWNFQRMDTLAGQTVGIVGIGGIGTAVAHRAQAFDMTVRALRRTDAPSPIPGVEVVTTIEDLVQDAHHVVLAAPGTPRTRHLLDADAFAAMRDGVHVVNIARGTLVDQDALRGALDSGKVARASLDTVDPEPLPAGHWIYSHPKVFLTPHSSWASSDLLGAAVDIFSTNLRRYLDGEPLQHVVDLDEGY